MPTWAARATPESQRIGTPEGIHEDVIGDIFSWDVVNWSRALDTWERWLPPGPDRVALAIGEREGGLSLWLARLGIQVICTDFRRLEAAPLPLHTDYGVCGRITYQRADVRSLPYSDASFDVVVFKSVLGALGTRAAQQRAVSEIRRVLKPGGVLLFAENLTGSRVHQMLRRRYVGWSQAWRYLDQETDRDLFGAFSTSELTTWGFLGLFGRSERQRRLLGRLDLIAARLVPKRHHYILYGACEK